MFRIARKHPWPPAVDLSMVRETLCYINDDMKRFPQFARIADAIDEALHEIKAAEARQPVVIES